MHNRSTAGQGRMKTKDSCTVTSNDSKVGCVRRKVFLFVKMFAVQSGTTRLRKEWKRCGETIDAEGSMIKSKRGADTHVRVSAETGGFVPPTAIGSRRATHAESGEVANVMRAGGRLAAASETRRPMLSSSVTEYSS